MFDLGRLGDQSVPIEHDGLVQEVQMLLITGGLGQSEGDRTTLCSVLTLPVNIGCYALQQTGPWLESRCSPCNFSVLNKKKIKRESLF